MLKNCTNCGGKLYFSPKNKGNVCENCSSIFPVVYDYKFSKKPFEENVIVEKDEFADALENVKCSSCGANLMFNKFQMQSVCPYCGSTTMVKGKKKKLLYIDSIVPFSYSKNEALDLFKSTVKKKFYANKKAFKNLTGDDISGVYVNTFVFDFIASSQYYGTLSFTKTVRDRDGTSRTKTIYRDVSGVIDKKFNNVSVEANSNIEQKELTSILPFDYSGAVAFKDDFMNGYILEYQDRMLDDCFKVAENIAKKQIEREILLRYNCDRIERLNLNTTYPDKRYNYCLLPIYIINKTDKKNKHHKVVMNGQTGKVGNLPKDKLRVFLTALFVALGIVGIALLIMYLV